MSWYGKSNISDGKKYSLPSVDSCSEYGCIKGFQSIVYSEVVMYSCCKLSDSYPRNYKPLKNLKKIFPSLIRKRVYLPVCEFSNRMIPARLNNGR